ncbi:flagellar hook-length control protein FliK [Defluviimonas sp. WL0075]|uniref:Flagellar hook-length control protein FliK n=1 Tax=Albidovulum sediminicola TaxID=2984331 RepID=A0ABT2Z4U3_9RHOB|nr:flagellar hook-length control protein FliK [Defluviimonas sp. WL0075]MCV2866096.1 flagellar hook-length control protein FliK [Defluviimonas sp. WL0075]
MALPSPAPVATALIPAAFAPGAGTFGDPRRDLPGAASRIAEQLAAAVAVRPEGVDVTLRPEELGHVRISIERRGAEVAVTVVADRAETSDLMRRHADLLAAEFRAAGFGNCSFHFGQQRGGQAPGRGGETVSDSKAEGVAGPPGSHPAAVEAATTQVGAGLDLRV